MRTREKVRDSECERARMGERGERDGEMGEIGRHEDGEIGRWRERKKALLSHFASWLALNKITLGLYCH